MITLVSLRFNLTSASPEIIRLLLFMGWESQACSCVYLLIYLLIFYWVEVCTSQVHPEVVRWERGHNLWDLPSGERSVLLKNTDGWYVSMMMALTPVVSASWVPAIQARLHCSPQIASVWVHADGLQVLFIPWMHKDGKIYKVLKGK